MSFTHIKNSSKKIGMFYLTSHATFQEKKVPSLKVVYTTITAPLNESSLNCWGLYTLMMQISFDKDVPLARFYMTKCPSCIHKSTNNIIVNKNLLHFAQLKLHSIFRPDET